ncbi:MAG: flagellar hook-basal body protein [Armatimonadetes bacterium]|nr:flagellar hook-basal body protein [Armatimonadota bacterium]
MNRGIYGAAAGMTACQDWMDVVANNLANVNTTGFKSDGVQFRDWMERTLRSEGGTGQEIGSIGAGPAVNRFFTDFSVGTLQETSRSTDVAITQPKGLFAVEGPTTGGPRNILYTRNGSFRVDAEGKLVNQDGYSVLDKNLNPILVDQNGEQPQIDELGNVTPSRVDPTNPAPTSSIGVFDGQFTKLGDSYYQASTPTTVLDAPQLRSGALENSNVQAIESMIQMISLNRIYELSQKAVTTQDEQTSKLLDSIKPA